MYVGKYIKKIIIIQAGLRMDRPSVFHIPVDQKIKLEASCCWPNIETKIKENAVLKPK